MNDWHRERRPRHAGTEPVIRAIVRSAINVRRMRVVGILNGSHGLIWAEGAKEMAEENGQRHSSPRRNPFRNNQSWESFRYKATENGHEVVYDYSSL